MTTQRFRFIDNNSCCINAVSFIYNKFTFSNDLKRYTKEM